MSVEPTSSSTARYERILVTGGSGFVGRHLLEALAGAYPEAQRLSLARPGEPAPERRWTPIAFDLLDPKSVDAAIAQAQPDLVVHLAAQASAAQSFLAAEETWRVNFDGAFNLASALARHAPAAVLLFASTADVYGASLIDGPAHEEMVPRPLSVYARSKLAAEAMLADVLPKTARLIVARPFSHIGPGQDKRFAVSSFAAQIVEIESGRAEPRLSVGDLSVQRDFLDVRDVIDAYLRLVAVAPGLPDRNVFDIASGETRPLVSLVEKMRALARRDFEIVVDPARLRPADIPIARCDAAKLRAATGWSPRRAIDETLVDLLDYCRAAAEAAK
ncbi:NAD-dependent epimerase/dehydratase family protein [Methylosinus sp. LW4]|uniref:NAD-dependent epimerase/dehydratase family protein n=1 Tax=Methylosinus sp. LW4 TaxID=136993 RepID=UPI00037B8464|nr:NAD-dependent epimerase/dehydratase family protein [Methylosinus sp. LW4]